MVKRILVPTDGSEYSRRAMTTAAEYARVLNAEITLLHVVSQPTTHMYDFTIDEFYPLSEDQVNGISHKVFEATCEQVEAGQVTIEKKAVTGYPASEILSELENDIDLVIMGSRGHRPLIGALIGSVTQRVIAEARCPVMVVK